ncbi:SCO3242 family prenyltransferase [Streptomyces sp. NPDC050504]|uniref:SCO3242 family prenyltransferase n=1 Tax=Streptomyces sp. NPDC050504 TaxID=3365618 RepID=UPI0037AEBF4E
MTAPDASFRPGRGDGPRRSPRTPPPPGSRTPALAAWAELLRVSALFTVPGDALAGAAATGLRPTRATACALASSLSFYAAGMALNDWADREEDAAERPHRPIPSGRVTPLAAFAAAGALTASGLALASRAGRPALAVAGALAATVWTYDLKAKHTPAGPAAMAAARALDLLLGATATAGTPALRALPQAALLAAHTYAVTAVSRHETRGGSTVPPLTALATTTALAATLVPRPAPPRTTPPATGAPPPAPTTTATAGRRARDTAPTRTHDTSRATAPARTHAPGRTHAAPGRVPARAATPARDAARAAARALPAALAVAAYLRTAGTPYLHAALNPSPPLTQRAVGGGIQALIPLQAALAARAGAPLTATALLGLAPLARRLARKVSPT